MSVFITNGTITFKAPNKGEYEIDYNARIYSTDQHRADDVSIEPSHGEEIDLEDWENWKEDMEKLALDDAYESMKKEMLTK